MRQKDAGQATVEAIMAFFFFFIVIFGIIEAGYLMYTVAEANAQVLKVGTTISADKLTSSNAANTIEKQIEDNSSMFGEGEVSVSNVTITSPKKINNYSPSVASSTGYDMNYSVSKEEFIVEYDVSYPVSLLFKLFTFESVELARHVKYDIPARSAYEVTG